jgi:putative oxidoreductase
MTSRKTDIALLLLRLCFGGLMFINHGIPKVARLSAEGGIKFADPLGMGPEISLWLALFAELGCAALVVLGLFTRLATVPLIITMAVAAFIVHGDDPFKEMEGALLFLIPYIALLLMGPGYYSADEQYRLSKV